MIKMLKYIYLIRNFIAIKNSINKNKSGKLSVVVGVSLSFFALQVQSACGSFEGVIDNKDGTVTDPRFGTIWKRCAEGGEFDDKARVALLACGSESKKMDWLDAMQAAKNSRFLGKDDWRIPTFSELYAITGHFPGIFKDCKPKDPYSGNYNGYAVSEMLQARQYWSTTRRTSLTGDLTGYFNTVSFASGESGSDFMTGSNYVILVRGGKPAPEVDGNMETQFEFFREYKTFVLPMLSKRSNQQQAETQQRQAFQNIIDSDDPQAMYLAAGKFRRQGQINYATAIYEVIISRFSSSPWAVKANDQLESSKPVDVYVR